MKKAVKEYKPLKIEDVRNIRGHRLSVLRQSRSKIPSAPGVYVWRYWPNIPSIEADSLLGTIEKLQRSFPAQTEKLSNSRLVVNIQKTPFGCKTVDGLLGIRNKKKVESFLNLLNKDEKARQSLAHTLEVMIASSPPIYIGKASNLRDRLSSHFDYETHLLKDIEDAEISKDDIYISYIIDELSSEEEAVTTSIEEILQRLTNPAYSKRYG